MRSLNRPLARRSAGLRALRFAIGYAAVQDLAAYPNDKAIVERAFEVRADDSRRGLVSRFSRVFAASNTIAWPTRRDVTVKDLGSSLSVFPIAIADRAVVPYDDKDDRESRSPYGFASHDLTHVYELISRIESLHASEADLRRASRFWGRSSGVSPPSKTRRSGARWSTLRSSWSTSWSIKRRSRANSSARFLSAMRGASRVTISW